jgi:thiol-disulfide isomerase/thioredoxin
LASKNTAWCKACKVIESSYHRLPQEFPSGVKFVEVPLTKENAYMHKGLGIPSLPFAHVYYNEDYVDNKENDETSSSSCRLVDELKINKNQFSELKRVIRSYVHKECDVHYTSGTNSTDDDTIIASSTPKRRQTNIDTTEDENEAIPVHY